MVRTRKQAKTPYRNIYPESWERLRQKVIKDLEDCTKDPEDEEEKKMAAKKGKKGGSIIKSNSEEKNGKKTTATKDKKQNEPIDGEMKDGKKNGKTAKRKVTEKVKNSGVNQPKKKRKKVAENETVTGEQETDGEVKKTTTKRQRLGVSRKSVSPVKNTTKRAGNASKNNKDDAVSKKTVAKVSPVKKGTKKTSPKSPKAAVVKSTAKKSASAAQKKTEKKNSPKMSNAKSAPDEEKTTNNNRKWKGTEEEKEKRKQKMREGLKRWSEQNKKNREAQKLRHEEEAKNPPVNSKPVVHAPLKTEVLWTVKMPYSPKFILDVAVGRRITTYGRDKVSPRLVQFDLEGREVQHVLYREDGPTSAPLEEVTLNGKPCVVLIQHRLPKENPPLEKGSDLKFLDLYNLNKVVKSHVQKGCFSVSAGPTKSSLLYMDNDEGNTFKVTRWLDCSSATPKLVTKEYARIPIGGPFCIASVGDKRLVIGSPHKRPDIHRSTDELIAFCARTGVLEWENTYNYIPFADPGVMVSKDGRKSYSYIDENLKCHWVQDENPKWLPGMTSVMNFFGLVTDGRGHLFVADHANFRIQVFSVLDGQYLGVLDTGGIRGLGVFYDLFWSEELSALVMCHKNRSKWKITALKINY